MPGGGTVKSKNWCFTLNNYTDVEYASIINACGTGDIQYIIVGKERGDNGTPHLQGFVQFSSQRRLNGVKKVLGSQRFHLEIARGTPAESKAYCSKEDITPYEFGNPIGQGQRTDMESFRADVLSGVSSRTLVENHFSYMLRYHRGLAFIRGIIAEPRSWRTQCIYVHGLTGSGKSRWVQEDAIKLCQQSVCWLPDASLKWFDGYETNTKGVVLDEFDGAANLTYLLRILDRYPLKVPVKGGFVEWNPRIVWITSQYPPSHWYGGEGEHYNALLRRIDETREINS